MAKRRRRTNRPRQKPQAQPKPAQAAEEMTLAGTALDAVTADKQPETAADRARRRLEEKESALHSPSEEEPNRMMMSKAMRKYAD